MYTMKTWYWGVTYKTYIYAYTHLDIIGSLMQFEVKKWLDLSKYTQKRSTEREGLRDDNPAVANAPGGVSVTTTSAANDDKAASATTLMHVYTVIEPMQQMNV